MGARRDDMVEVVLEDDGDPDVLGSPSAAGLRGRLARGRPWSPRRRRAWVAAGLVLAVGVGVAGSDSESTQALPVVGVPGLSVSLMAPLHVVWQAGGRVTATLPDGSAVLVTTADGVEAREVASGALLWRSADAVGWCELGGSGQAPPPDHGRPVAICSLQDGTTVEALDAVTGEVLVEVDAPTSLWSMVVVDDDIVLAGVDTAGHVTVARWSTATGEQAWSTVGPVVDSLAQGISVQSDGPVLTVDWAGGSMDVDAATGAQLSVTDAPVDQASTSYRFDLADGLVANQSWTLGNEGLLDAQVRVERPDGSTALEVPGYVLRPSVDDGSAAGVVLVLDDGSSTLTRAYDLATGDELWSDAISADLVVGGRIVGSAATGELEAVSAATGDVLWTQHTVPAPNTSSMVSDGRRMLSIEGPDLRLVARSLVTGREVWSMDQPWVTAASAEAYGAIMSTLPSGLVVLSSGDRTLVLGP